MLVIVMGVATSMFVRPTRGALMLTICKHHRTTCGIPPALSTEAPDRFNCQRRSIALRKCSTRGEMYARRVVADALISVQPVKVVVPEIPVRRAIAKDVPRGDKNRMGDGHDDSLVATASSQPTLLRHEVAVLGPNGTPTALDQGGTQPAVALASLTA
jgi:hypothetical protein